MAASVCELFLVEIQCDNTRSKLQNIQVDMTFIIPKLIDGVPSRAKGA